ncbi:hypothetical protein FRC11_015028 [Ceratobasidium sp. 423]|nr:hypothetical protein FRC11_015028 [Ceratobasidium sp. 423]
MALLSKDRHGPGFPCASDRAGTWHYVRFQRLKMIEDIEKAIEYQAQAVSFTPHGHADMSRRLGGLGNSHVSRYQLLGHQDDLDKAIECLVQAATLTSKGHASLPHSLNGLGNGYALRFQITNQVKDIDAAISCHTDAIALMPEDHPLLPNILNNLALSYRWRSSGGVLSDVDRAIECQARAVASTSLGDPRRSGLLNRLAYLHKVRSRSLGYPTSTYYDTIECYRQSTQCPTGHPYERFRAAYQWARLIFPDNHSEKLQAYQVAFNLVPRLVWLGMSISQRYRDVEEVGKVVVEGAAAAINAQQYALGLEWLEQGRSVVWSQTLQLRTPLEELFAVHPELAQQLQDATVALHNSTSTSLDSISTQFRHLPSSEIADHAYRRQAERYDELVDKVRQQARFEDFLLPVKAPELISMPHDGPVVVINIDKSRSDALVILPGHNDITHIPLYILSSEKIETAYSQMNLALTNQGLRERGDARRPLVEMEDNCHSEFEDVLAMLWTDVVRPVLDCLGYIVSRKFNDLPRITWCTTGKMSFLPLHAAGIYDPTGARISDYVISSYTPTLGALRSQRSYSRDNHQHSRLLAIGQEITPGHSSLPGVRRELISLKRHIQAPHTYIQLENASATKRAVLDAMELSDWLHLAGHAHQCVSDPTQSGFFLHDGVLSLADIGQKDLKNKGLAFLSACQTATGDHIIPDESVHLASGLLTAGYPSVIATMWSVQDADAPVIANGVYRELMKDGMMDYRKAAMALHKAVGELRAEVGDKQFGRWVPFIHLGV